MKTKTGNDLTLVKLLAHYNDADKAREFLETLRWPNGPVCPHCKSNEAYRLTPKPTAHNHQRKGLCKCKTCRKQYTVTVGTIFEDSHIPLNKWLLAVYLICSSKKAISAHQLHRSLEITYKSAWFLAHRIRYAIKQGPLQTLLGGIVEADETWVGGKRKNCGRAYTGNKTPVVALVERGGRVRSQVVPNVTGKNLRAVLKANVETSAHIHTDQLHAYKSATKGFASHESVNHSAGEYARGNVHCNTAESNFALLKRGIIGTYHHVSEKHLPLYTGEFDFRFNHRKISDGERTVAALGAIEGKRLTYRWPYPIPTA